MVLIPFAMAWLELESIMCSPFFWGLPKVSVLNPYWVPFNWPRDELSNFLPQNCRQSPPVVCWLLLTLPVFTLDPHPGLPLWLGSQSPAVFQLLQWKPGRELWEGTRGGINPFVDWFGSSALFHPAQFLLLVIYEPFWACSVPALAFHCCLCPSIGTWFAVLFTCKVIYQPSIRSLAFRNLSSSPVSLLSPLMFSVLLGLYFFKK